MRAQTSFAVRFQPLPEAVELLRRRMPVRVHLGAGESFGTLVFGARPAGRCAVLDATLHLREATAAVPGQRFVVRRMSPKTVLGGGTIGIPAAAEAEPTVSADVTAVLAARLRQSASQTNGVDAIAAAANVTLERAEEILTEEAAADRVWMLTRPLAYVDADIGEALLERVLASLTRREAETPWLLGATSLALAREFGTEEALLVRILAAAAERQRLTVRNGYYARTPASSRGLSPEQVGVLLSSTFSGRRRATARAVGVRTARHGNCAIRASPDCPGALLTRCVPATGRLVRVGDHVYRGEQLAEIRTRLVRALRAEGRLTAAQFRDVVGTSRKYIVPLLEFFDATGVTVRDGDQRALRGS